MACKSSYEVHLIVLVTVDNQNSVALVHWYWVRGFHLRPLLDARAGSAGEINR